MDLKQVRSKYGASGFWTGKVDLYNIQHVRMMNCLVRRKTKPTTPCHHTSIIKEKIAR
jgi:hypothetical protein